MSAEAFLDTNVLLYHIDQSDARKHAIAERIVRDAVATEAAVISGQVVNEFLNVVLRKAQLRLAPASARAYLDVVLSPLLRELPSPALQRRGLLLHERFGFAFYDSLIVAAALEAGCKRLLSEDLQHGQRIDGLRIENPFRA